MATRTISVSGGTRNWDDVLSWVEAAVPTSADDVVATALSGNLTVNVAAACRSIDLTGYVGTLTHNASVALSVGDGTAGPGNVALKFVAGMTYTGATAASSIVFVSTVTASPQTVTVAGKSTPTVSFNAAGKWQLQDALTGIGSSSINHNFGTLDTNGKTITYSALASSNSNVRTLTLGASSITLTGTGSPWNLSTFTNLTLNPGTSTITLTGTSATFAGGATPTTGISYHDVVLGGAGMTTVSGNAITFANLTRTGTAAKTDGLIHNTTAGGITVTGTLTLTANSLVNALLVASVTVGSARTITCNGSVVVSGRIDFRDITGAGSASWNLSGSTTGDSGGNSSITFTAATTRYGVVAGNASSTATWSATSGGSGGASVPLPQDNVFFDASSAAGTYTIDMPRFGKNVDCTGFTRTLSLSAGSAGISLYGSLILSSGMTLSGTETVTFEGRSTYTLTSAGKAFGGTVALSAPSGTLTLQDAFSGTALSLAFGTFTANNQNVTLTGLFSSTVSNVRVLNMGTGTWTMSGAGSIWSFSGANLTVNASSSVIDLTNTSGVTRTFAGGGFTYATLRYTAVTNATLSITGNNTFATLQVSGGTKTVEFANNSNTTITTAFDVNGAAGSLITINRASVSTFTLTKSSGVVNPNYLDIRNSAAGGGAQWVAANSTNGGGDTGWIFGAAAQAASASASSAAPTDSTGPSPAEATAAASAPAPSVTLAVPSELASASSAAGDALPSVGPHPDAAPATLTALDPSIVTTVSPGTASAAAAALDASAATAVVAPAEAVQSSAASQDPAVAVAPSPDAAAGAGTAQDPSVSIAASAGAAAGSGSPGDPNGTEGVGPSVAQASSAAQDPSPALSAATAAASASASSSDPASAVAPTAQTASTAGSAFDATVSTLVQTFADAGMAAVLVQALDPSSALAVPSDPASGFGSGQDPAPSVAPFVAVALSAAAAPSASPSVGPGAGAAGSVVTAHGPGLAVLVSAGAAGALAAAYSPASSVAPVAGAATASAVAYDATTTSVTGAPGSVTVAASFPSVAVSVSYAGVVVGAEASGGTVEVGAEAT